MIDAMSDSNEPERPDFAFRGGAIGLLAGALVGLGHMHWNKLTGQWMKYPEGYLVFWSLVGLIAGLLIGLFCYIWKEPKRTGFVDGLTIGLTSGLLFGLAQIVWYGLTGQKYQAAYLVYWSLFGLIAGLMQASFFGY